MAVLGRTAPRNAVQLGQSRVEWLARARAALAQYGAFFERADRIIDQAARNAVLEWLGQPDVPGSPAERAERVRSDVEVGLGPYAEETAQTRVSQLEEALTEFGARVEEAEKIGGTTLVPGEPGAGGVPTGVPPAGFFAGGLALLALVVVPLLVD